MRRETEDKVFRYITLIFSIIASLPLFLITLYVLYKGLPVISWSFLTKPPEGFGANASGGIAHAIVGTIYTIIVAAFIGIPLGIFTGVFLAKRKSSRLYRYIERSVGSLLGTPSVIVGLLIYFLLVIHTGPCAFAGGVSLAIVMRPMIGEATRIAIEALPREIEEGGYALGAKRAQVMMDITIPASWRGILVGIILATGRALGEAAPILFTSGYSEVIPRSVWDPAPTLPYVIYVYALYYPRQIYRSWARGASAILLLLSLTLVYLSWRLRE